MTDRRDPSPAVRAATSPIAGLTADELVASHRRHASSPDPTGRSSAAPSTPGRSCPGNLFVALPGERTDGHALRRRGARTRAPRPRSSPGRPTGSTLDDVEATVVQVDDPLRGAAGASRPRGARRFDPLVVGVTGSIAKTSTKEAIATVLGAALPTLKNEGNQNNEIGLPLTVLRLAARAPGRGPRDGDVRRRRDRRPGRGSAGPRSAS